MPEPDILYGKPASVLITGASSGIGAALAQHLAEHGGRLALIARREDRLQEVARRVAARGATPCVVPADVTDAEAVRLALERVAAEQGPVDVAFLNAGVADLMVLPRFDVARMRRLFEVNLFGVLNCLEMLLPDMISRGRGVIAVTSSLAAVRSLPGNGAYAASKAALSILLDNLRADGRRFGLQVSIIEPGYVKSELTARVKSPMPFMMEADDAARLIAQGVADGRSLIRFPTPMTAAAQVLRHLPAPLYDRVFARMLGLRKPADG